MFAKAIGTIFLLGILSIHSGSALQCYSCDTPASCKSPTEVTCDYNRANTTTAHLHNYFTANLSNLTSENYDCFFHNYTSVANNVTYKGCVYRVIEPCSLTLKDEHKQLVRKDCFKCSGSLCNPAGTFSSSMMAMIGSILTVALYKALKM